MMISVCVLSVACHSGTFYSSLMNINVKDAASIMFPSGVWILSDDVVEARWSCVVLCYRNLRRI